MSFMKVDGYYKVWQKIFCYKWLCPVLQSDVCYNVWQNFITSASGISSCVRYYMWQNFFTNCFSYDKVFWSLWNIDDNCFSSTKLMSIKQKHLSL